MRGSRISCHRGGGGWVEAKLLHFIGYLIKTEGGGA